MTDHVSQFERVDKPRHARQLDSVRAFAAIAVIFHHEGPFPRMPFFRELGNYGVALFFVLSGFLITGILLRARDDAERGGVGFAAVLRAFYARRSLRIFPLYYLVLFALVAFGVANIRQSAPWHALYLSNVLSARAGSYVFPVHFWSLSVEEQFYFGWAPIALLLPRRWIYGAVMAMIVVGPVSRLVIFLVRHSTVTATVLPTSCMDLLGMGCLLAYFWHQGAEYEAVRRRLGRVALPLGLMLVGVQTVLSVLQRGDMLRATLWSAPVALIGFWLVDRAYRGFDGPVARILEWPPLVYLGTISYGLYVYHIFVPYGLRGLGIAFPQQPGTLKFVVVLSITVAVSAASWHLFEAPINGLKERFPYMPRSQRAEYSDEALARSSRAS